MSLLSIFYLVVVLNLCTNTAYRQVFAWVPSDCCTVPMCDMGSNDVYDFDTGADINKKESVVNIVGR